jgi:alpha/beta hydrolase family protein
MRCNRWFGPAAVSMVTLLLLAGCSSSSRSTSTSTTGGPNNPAAPTRPASGPAATISGPITGGKGVSLGAASTTDLAAAGYSESEFFASGTAQSYKAMGALGNDGRWAVEPDASASYRTRIVVREPRDPAKFNGTVLVEWLNVSGGADGAPDFSYMAPELLRSGYAWVGVSAQQIGVSGGVGVVPVQGAPSGGLLGIDPMRYGTLHHPGDAYAYDIFSQAGRALLSPGTVNALGSLRPQRVLAIGESQSAFELTTYINAIQTQAHVFDGFFVHSRGGGATPLAGGNIGAGINGAVMIRDDINVPVLLFETETDEAFLRYFDARQPDSSHIRLWDVAGAAHADAYLVGNAAPALGCKGAINQAPTHYVVNAAIHQLDQWARSGAAPPTAPRMEVKLVNGPPVVQRDPLGVAIGGVRTAAIDVPVAAYSGVPVDMSSVVCSLFGSTHPFDAATLHRLYPTEAAYLDAFTRATDNAVAAGYILAADRSAILSEAQRVNI